MNETPGRFDRADGTGSTHDEIDRAIDVVLRDMVAVPAPADLRRRVIDRLTVQGDAPDRAAAVLRSPRLAWSGAAAAIVIAVAVTLLRDREPRGPAPSPAVTSARASLPDARLAPPAPSDQATPAAAGAAPRRERAPGAKMSPGAVVDTASLSELIDPLQVPDVLAMEPLETESIAIDDLSIAALDVEPLDVEPLPPTPR